jgi:hypothetical protein
MYIPQLFSLLFIPFGYKLNLDFWWNNKMVNKWYDEKIKRIKEARNYVVKCEDCGMLYSDFPLDVVLSDKQWYEITHKTDGSGILCAACIVKRGSRIPDFTVAKLKFE